MKRTVNRLFTLLLCLVMLFTLCPAGAGAAGRESKAVFKSRLSFDIDDGTTVRAIIVYGAEGNVAMSNRGVSPSAYGAQVAVSPITKQIVRDYNAAVKFSYNALFKGVAVDVSYGDLKAIERLDGVEKVYIANRYSAPKATVGETAKATYAGKDMNMPSEIKGDKGEGTIIAVLDTGFNTNHEAFSADSVETPKLTAKGLQDVKDSPRGLTGGGIYVNDKIPYAFDYADWDHDVSTEDGHGTAVASIAAGDNGSDFHGVAPAAQILAMKIFDDASGTTDSSVYLAAMEDAYLMGADVINMSLGAESGFTYDYELEDGLYGDIYSELKAAGVAICCAAGNEYSSGYAGYTHNWFSKAYGEDAVLAGYTDYGTVGSPSTFEGAISVASANNMRYWADVVVVDGKKIECNDSADEDTTAFFNVFAGNTLDYVVIPGVGEDADYEGINVNGKVAVVQRGTIDFQSKLQYAANHGALAMICYNNQAGDVIMHIDNFMIPAVSVSQEAGEIFINATEKKVYVAEEQALIKEESIVMSDFSSWGVTPDLKLKPEITGIGGNVLCASVSSNNNYISMSGTSMACPTVAGAYAVFMSIFRALGADEGMTAGEFLDDVSDIILNSAKLAMYDGWSPVSPRKQGLGLVDGEAASFVTAVFDEPVVNLGDDPEKTGVYTFTATLEHPFPEYWGMLGSEMALSTAYVGTDALYADENTDSVYALNAPSVLSADVKTDKAIYTLGKNEKKVEVEITITLDEYAKEYLNAYPNGGFVEGYLVFTDKAYSQAMAKIAFVGYYGDWTAAPALETYDWGEVVDAQVKLNTERDEFGNLYVDNGMTYYDFLEMNLGYNEGYLACGDEIIGYLGDNLYGWTSFNADRIAFSTDGAVGEHLANSFIIYPTLLRNVRHIIMTVSNADTGEIYYVDDTEYARKNYYDPGLGDYAPYTIFMWDGTVDGEYVPHGTKVKVTFETQLDYPDAPLVKEREYIMYVDNKAPQFTYDWDAANKLLKVKAKDDRYISNIEVYCGDYESLLVDELVTDTTPGEYKEWSFDLSGADLSAYDNMTLKLQDYATNYDSVNIATADSTPPYVLGDVTGDGKVNSLDAAFILRYDAALKDFDAEQLIVADVSRDGKVNSLDAALVLRFDAALIPDFEW
ncbi:MAG: S8 family serine peptidase [Clostridia bacterium]|nr:S8 family serine peptidase [Clostridia bacterium]